MDGKRILLIDESSALRKMISAYLTQLGWAVQEAPDLDAARDELVAGRPNFAVLQLESGAEAALEMLDDLDVAGIDVIVTSESARLQDRLACLERGAADYMTTPIDLRELSLRLKRLRRRRPGPTLPVSMEMACGAAILDIASRTLRGASVRPVPLTPSEFRLLYLLLRNDTELVDRALIARDVLGHTESHLSRSVDVMVSKLRRKLGLSGSGRFIRNVRSEGYVLASEERGARRLAAGAFVADPAYAGEFDDGS